MLLVLQRGACPHQDSMYCSRCSAQVLQGVKDSYCTILSEDDGLDTLQLVIVEDGDPVLYLVPAEIWATYGPEGMESLLENIAEYRLD